MKKLAELLTGDDNVTLEPAYFWACIIIVIGLGLEIYSVIMQHPFDFQGYGMASGGLLGGLGIGAKLGK